ncbi:MAG: hypothetical protein AAF750_18390, partial [Planctomycetota bacterium]
LFMLGLLAAGFLTPAGAAVGQVLSSLVVIFNSARLVRVGEHLEQHDPTPETAPTRPVHTTPVALPA